MAVFSRAMQKHLADTLGAAGSLPWMRSWLAPAKFACIFWGLYNDFPAARSAAAGLAKDLVAIGELVKARPNEAGRLDAIFKTKADLRLPQNRFPTLGKKAFESLCAKELKSTLDGLRQKLRDNMAFEAVFLGHEIKKDVREPAITLRKVLEQVQGPGRKPTCVSSSISSDASNSAKLGATPPEEVACPIFRIGRVHISSVVLVLLLVGLLLLGHGSYLSGSAAPSLV
ncbi:hypothetical protein JCM8547_005062 [Rhodosporidiobolus lusitaniae]